MNKKQVLVGIGIVVLFTLGWFVWQRDSAIESVAPEEEPLSVVTTFYPLEVFAAAVGGERTRVSSIVPSGTEPHDYEPTPKDILSAYQADIFLLNGGGVDAWAEKIRPELEERGVVVIQMSELVEFLPVSEEAHEEETHEEEHHDADHSHGAYSADPHFWLDPLLAERAVFAIRDALIARDNAGKAVYDDNSMRYGARLQELHATYQQGLQTCDMRTIVTSHNAFSYLAKRYGFEVLALSGLSPESDISARHLAEMTVLARERGIKYVFFETLVSPKVAETLAAEVGAKTLLFHPLEGLTAQERAAGDDYFSIMERNLVNLRTALTCRTE